MDARLDFDHAAGWYAQTAAAPKRWPPLAFDLDVDVCVVGGGLAGLTTALEIARRGWSVAVLEARRIAWNASGRNLGFVLPGFGQDVGRIVERCGLDHARALWNLSADGVESVRSLIRDTDMPGVSPVAGWLDVSKVDRGDEMVAAVSLLGQEFGADVEGWPVEKVRSVLRTDRYFHAIHYPQAFHVHALNYALGLAAAAEAAGVRIFEETPALTVDAAGLRKRIATPAARLRAAHIVLAGNTYLGGVDPVLAQTVLPIWTFVALTEPLGEGLKEAIAYTGAVSDSHTSNHHYRIVDGDRLLWSGGSTTWEASARGRVGMLRRSIAQTYPQLGEVEIAQVWSGAMGFSVHGMPQIGELSPGLWVANAFGGHGLNTTAMAGSLLARAIVENDDTWRLFLPYDLVWAGGGAGRVIRQGVSMWRRGYEAAQASAARKREEKARMAAAVSDSDESAEAALEPAPVSETGPEVPRGADRRA
jgi:glycine/D-amino acid oxidase-like deaminating enzyme